MRMIEGPQADGRVYYNRAWRTPEQVDRLRERNRGYMKRKRVERPAFFAEVAAARRLTVSGRARYLTSDARKRARLKGLEFSISPSWVAERLKAGRCEATGLQFDLRPTTGNGRFMNPFAPSLDRKDSARGYTPDNVQVVCTIHNLSRGPFSDATHRRYVEACAQAYGLLDQPPLAAAA